MISILFLAMIWTLVGVLLTAETLWRSRRVRPTQARAFVRALVIALMFTPFVPHSSIEWSTPWPPAAVWLVLSLVNGKVIQLELFTIAGVTLILWVLQRAVHDGSRNSASD